MSPYQRYQPFQVIIFIICLCLLFSSSSSSMDSPKFRIVFDYSPLFSGQSSSSTASDKQVIQNLCEIAAIQISMLVQPFVRTQPINIPTSINQCYDINITTRTFYNADLVVLVGAYSDPKDNVYANAIACYYETQPLVGRIKANLAHMNSDTISNTDDLFIRMWVHEIIHILGFSYSGMTNWINPSSQTNQPYNYSFYYKGISQLTINGDSYNTLITPHIKKLFQQHYGCINPNYGLPLSQPSNSHWNTASIGGESMNPQVYSEISEITLFTTALLRDTGFFQQINNNLASTSGWGLNKGCEFIKSGPKSVVSTFNEFNSKFRNSSFGCDPSGHGKGVAKQRQVTGVDTYELDLQWICSQQNKQSIEYTGEQFGDYSKCFESDLTVKGIWNPYVSAFGDTRCYKVQCNINNGRKKLRIQVLNGNDDSEIIVICEYPRQVIFIDASGYQQNQTNLYGTITCPNSFSPYCSYKKLCVNSCSHKGTCNHGICACMEGFGGVDCSIKLKDSKVVTIDGDINQSCPSGTYKGFDQVCVTTCPPGYYPNNSKQICDLCWGNCLECSGDLGQDCLSCVGEYILINKQCIQSEPVTSSQCGIGCRLCNNQSQCLDCLTNYYFTASFTCSPCGASCQECNLTSDNCTSCYIGYQLQQNTNKMSCIANTSLLPCQKIYKQPNSLVTKCVECQDGYFLSLSSNTCVQCGFQEYLNQNTQTCQLCHSNCLTCRDSPEICTSCQEGYILNIQEHLCLKVGVIQSSTSRQLQQTQSKQYLLPQQDCHYSCKQCIDKTYMGCVECSGNRIRNSIKIEGLNGKNMFWSSTCDCQNDQLDTMEEYCHYEDNWSIQGMKNLLQLSIIGSWIVQGCQKDGGQQTQMNIVQNIFQVQLYFLITLLPNKILLSVDQLIQHLQVIVFLPFEDNSYEKRLNNNNNNYETILGKNQQQSNHLRQSTFGMNDKLLTLSRDTIFLSRSVLIVSLHAGINFAVVCLTFYQRYQRSKRQDQKQQEVSKVNVVIKLLRLLISIVSVGMFQQIIFNGMLALQSLEFGDPWQVIDVIFAVVYILIFSYFFMYRQFCVQQNERAIGNIKDIMKKQDTDSNNVPIVVDMNEEKDNRRQSVKKEQVCQVELGGQQAEETRDQEQEEFKEDNNQDEKGVQLDIGLEGLIQGIKQLQGRCSEGDKYINKENLNDNNTNPPSLNQSVSSQASSHLQEQQQSLMKMLILNNSMQTPSQFNYDSIREDSFVKSTTDQVIDIAESSNVNYQTKHSSRSSSANPADSLRVRAIKKQFTSNQCSPRNKDNSPSDNEHHKNNENEESIEINVQQQEQQQQQQVLQISPIHIESHENDQTENSWLPPSQREAPSPLTVITNEESISTQSPAMLIVRNKRKSTASTSGQKRIQSTFKEQWDQQQEYQQEEEKTKELTIEIENLQGIITKPNISKDASENSFSNKSCQCSRYCYLSKQYVTQILQIFICSVSVGIIKNCLISLYFLMGFEVMKIAYLCWVNRKAQRFHMEEQRKQQEQSSQQQQLNYDQYHDHNYEHKQSLVGSIHFIFLMGIYLGLLQMNEHGKFSSNPASNQLIHRIIALIGSGMILSTAILPTLLVLPVTLIAAIKELWRSYNIKVVPTDSGQIKGQQK